MRMDELFIGYAPPMPPGLARFVRRLVVTLGCSVSAWAIVAAAGHVPLRGGTFAFGHPMNVSGTIVERPYPALDVDAANGSLASWTLLVAPGKHGADALVRGLNGRHVTIAGTRIQRDAHIMIEVESATVVASTTGRARPVAEDTAPTLERDVQFTGEIVDSKCFLGVMVPGAGKTHADCASLCIRGGIPPALSVQDGSGRSTLLLLTGPAGEPIHAQAVEAAGHAISVSGTMLHQGGWLVLRTDPRGWHPARK